MFLRASLQDFALALIFNKIKQIGTFEYSQSYFLRKNEKNLMTWFLKRPNLVVLSLILRKYDYSVGRNIWQFTVFTPLCHQWKNMWHFDSYKTIKRCFLSHLNPFHHDFRQMKIFPQRPIIFLIITFFLMLI